MLNEKNKNKQIFSYLHLKHPFGLGLALGNYEEFVYWGAWEVCCPGKEGVEPKPRFIRLFNFIFRSLQTMALKLNPALYLFW